MGDRLTQLQDAVNAQAENFCNSFGVLQQFSKPSPFTEFEKSATNSNSTSSNSTAVAINGQVNNQNQEDFGQLFASLIAQTAKDIDILIDSLPSEESTPELQASHLRRMEAENQESYKHLEETVRRGEKLLNKIQSALQDIAQAQLRMA